MNSMSQSNNVRAVLHAIVLIALVFSSIGRVSLVRAQEETPEIPTETPTPEPPADTGTPESQMETPAATGIPTELSTPPDTATPSLAPFPTLTPTEEMLSVLDLSSAGMGTIFREPIGYWR